VALALPRTVEAAFAALSRPGSVPPGLSTRMHRLLADGDVEGTYRSGSEVVQAVAQAFVNRGLSFANLLWALLDDRNGGGEALRRRYDQGGGDELTRLPRAEEWLQRSWDSATARASHHPPFAGRA